MAQLAKINEPLYSAHYIAEGDEEFTVQSGETVDAWEDCTIIALPGSHTNVVSPGVTVYVHPGAKLTNRKKVGTIIDVPSETPASA